MPVNNSTDVGVTRGKRRRKEDSGWRMRSREIKRMRKKRRMWRWMKEGSGSVEEVGGGEE